MVPNSSFIWEVTITLRHSYTCVIPSEKQRVGVPNLCFSIVHPHPPLSERRKISNVSSLCVPEILPPHGRLDDILWKWLKNKPYQPWYTTTSGGHRFGTPTLWKSSRMTQVKEWFALIFYVFRCAVSTKPATGCCKFVFSTSSPKYYNGIEVLYFLINERFNSPMPRWSFSTDS